MHPQVTCVVSLHNGNAAAAMVRRFPFAAGIVSERLLSVPSTVNMGKRTATYLFLHYIIILMLK